MIARKLNILDLDKLVKHLCKLQGEDRRLRFGVNLTDEAIKNYVDKSFNDDKSQWFGCDSDGNIVSACHVAIYNNEGELGCSVDSEYRGHGLAQEMFDRAVTYLRAHDIKEVYMHCLTENQVMKHIAKKHDMVVISCDGEKIGRAHV